MKSKGCSAEVEQALRHLAECLTKDQEEKEKWNPHPPQGRFKPPVGHTYFFTLQDDGEAYEADLDGDKRQLALMRVQDKYEEFRIKAGVVFDWRDHNQTKYNNAYDHDISEWVVGNNQFIQTKVTEMHSTEEGCEWVGENMADDLDLIYGREK